MRVGILVCILLAPLVAAHAPHERPSIQSTQEKREVYAELVGVNATFEFLQKKDPPSDFIQHQVDPRRGSISVEYRPQLPQVDEAFRARFVLERIIEYRDQNQDGQYSPNADTVVRSWRSQGYAWEATPPRSVSVADVQGQDVVWTGNISGGPSIRLEVVASGSAFVDEGATVRQQDVIVYLDILALPPRGTGNLHALEGLVTTTPGATVRLDSLNLTTSLLVEAPGRLAVLDWGAEAIIDGEERNVLGTLGERTSDGHPFWLGFPRAEKSVRLVLVSGIEYAEEDKRAPGLGGGVVVAFLALVALTRSRVRG